MISPTVVGALAIGVPSLFLAYVFFFWRRPADLLVRGGADRSSGSATSLRPAHSREFGIAIVGEAETLSPVP